MSRRANGEGSPNTRRRVRKRRNRGTQSILDEDEWEMEITWVAVHRICEKEGEPESDWHWAATMSRPVVTH